MASESLHRSEETIFALASGVGRAGVAVIRLSGQASSNVCQELTGAPPPPARKAQLVTISSPLDGEIIDRGLVLWFPAPASFTGEDVLEFHLHGGPAVLAMMFEAMQRRCDVRPADPGEFSRRSFMNGKMDLTAAEGLADLVAAETRQQARQARRQLDGALGRHYGDWHARLLEALALLEAEIDFAPEEEVPDDLLATVLPKLDLLLAEIERHLADNRRGERLRNGLRVALIGPPNAGKSSLLNHLAARDIAIVTDIPGTTRDVLETPLDLAGYPVVLVDMAGLRTSEDPVERLGIERAHSEAADADLRLLLFDGAHWPEVDPTTAAFMNDESIVALNKSDLLLRNDDHRIEGRETHLISCHTGDGIENLVTTLGERAARAMAPGDLPVLTRLRHRQALADVVGALKRVQDAEALPELALIAEDVRMAMQSMGRITGKVNVESVLDQIFSSFCIGK